MQIQSLKDTGFVPNMKWAAVAGYTALGVLLFVAIFHAAQRALANLEQENRRAAVVPVAGAPVVAGDELFSILVRELACASEDDVESPEYGVQVGIGSGERVGHWQRAESITESPDPRRRNTLMAAARDGDFWFAVGPLHVPAEGESQRDTASATGSLVLIDGRPYALVHREPVRNLMTGRRSERRAIEFDDERLGITGRIEIRHVL